MASKNLDEAVKKAVGTGLVTMHQNLKNEIRDYLAHQTMQFLGAEPTEHDENLLNAFFKKVVGE